MDNLEKITEAQMDEKGVCAAPDILTGTPAENKAMFDRMVRQLVAPIVNAAIDAVNAINHQEVSIGEAEEIRVTAENERIAAEISRAAAEVLRAAAEQERQHAETGYVAQAAGSAKEAQSWAVGGTGYRQGEDSDNARYWAGKAEDVAGGNFAKKVKSAKEWNLAALDGNGDLLDSGKSAEELEIPRVPYPSNEMDNYTGRIGAFSNAGAGWNSFRFPAPFAAAPVVAVQPVGFSGWIEIKGVTPEGFLYCLRRPKLMSEAVSREAVYVAGGTGTSPSHTQKTIVTAIADTAIGSETVEEPVEVYYLAFEFGGEY